MKENIIRDVYVERKLLNSSTIVTDNLIHDDLDFNNIIGMHLLPDDRVNYLGGKESSKYIEYLDQFMIDNFDLFFYSDIEHGRLYFECLVGSKSNVNTKYIVKKLICQIENDDCPSCSSKLKIKSLGTKPTKIDGETRNCAKFSIYCPKCDGMFGVYGFKATHILKSLFYETSKLFKSIESVKIGSINGGEIKIKSNFDAVYRC